MKSVRKPIVTSDKKTDDTITHGSLTLYVDTSYRKEHHARQWGYMAADFQDLKKGEKVYWHYLSVLEEPTIPPDKWILDYKMIYCVIRDEKIVALNDYLFVEIIKEEEIKTVSGIIVPDNLKNKNSATKGKVAYTVSPELASGDTILFTANSAFVNNIEGEDYYIMETQDALAKLN